MNTIINIDGRTKFIEHMDNAIKTGLLTNIDMCMRFYDKGILLKDKQGKVLLNNNMSIILHVYNDMNDTTIVYVLVQDGNKHKIQQVLEVKELYRSVVLNIYEYQVSQVLYKGV